MKLQELLAFPGRIMKNIQLVLIGILLFAWLCCAEDVFSGENAMKMHIDVGGKTLVATLADNSSARALVEQLGKGAITVNMRDYGNMEKVGPLPTTLPRNDTDLRTGPGDIILYQGNQFAIYYDTNAWNLTQLGKIDGATRQGLLDVLGKGSVSVTLSLAE